MHLSSKTSCGGTPFHPQTVAHVHWVAHPQPVLLYTVTFHTDIMFNTLLNYFRYARENSHAHEKISAHLVWSVPEYLRNRPPYIIKHCMTQIHGGQYPNIGMISEIDKRVFKVSYKRLHVSYGNVVCIIL